MGRREKNLHEAPPPLVRLAVAIVPRRCAVAGWFKNIPQVRLGTILNGPSHAALAGEKTPPLAVLHTPSVLMLPSLCQSVTPKPGPEREPPRGIAGELLCSALLGNSFNGPQKNRGMRAITGHRRYEQLLMGLQLHGNTTVTAASPPRARRGGSIPEARSSGTVSVGIPGQEDDSDRWRHLDVCTEQHFEALCLI